MKLTHTQQAVLTAAADHPAHRIEHLPENLKGAARAKVLASLTARSASLSRFAATARLPLRRSLTSPRSQRCTVRSDKPSDSQAHDLREPPCIASATNSSTR
jgi:hypothetical protein